MQCPTPKVITAVTLVILLALTGCDKVQQAVQTAKSALPATMVKDENPAKGDVPAKSEAPGKGVATPVPKPTPEEEAKLKAEAEAAAAAAAALAKEQEGLQAGLDAVVYGYPLVLMELTKRKMTNVDAPTISMAPVNQFAHMTAFPDASFKDVVRPNVDTLYSSAWLDLTKEPLVLSVPDTHGRYYLLPMLDAWTNVFASPGKRTTGTKAQRFLITGPGWSGVLPKGLQEIKAPTNTVWIIGRIQTSGPKDYKAVHAIQRQFHLTPLSALGKRFKPAAGSVDANVDMKTPPAELLAKLDTTVFLNVLTAAMKQNLPAQADMPLLLKLAKIGVAPGEPFDPSKLDPTTAKGVVQALPTALKQMDEAANGLGSAVNGWRLLPPNTGNYGTDYTTRAMVAMVAFGANLPADAIYPMTMVDGEGKGLSGGTNYVLHFDKGQLPPARAFWSVTLYDAEGAFVANPLSRFAISSWMPFHRNKDGSVDLYVQRDWPGPAKQANWLPAPPGEFNLTLRLYWPRDKNPSILDGTWQPPAVTKAG